MYLLSPNALILGTYCCPGSLRRLACSDLTILRLYANTFKVKQPGAICFELRSDAKRYDDIAWQEARTNRKLVNTNHETGTNVKHGTLADAMHM